jgi:hypothetical protein
MQFVFCILFFKQFDAFEKDQAQASEQFLASIKLASNKAICLKTKKINKSNMYFDEMSSCEPESYDFILLDKTLSKLSTGLKH